MSLNVIFNIPVRRPCELLQSPIIRRPPINLFDFFPLTVHDQLELNFDRVIRLSCKSIKYGGVKLVLWANPPLLVK